MGKTKGLWIGDGGVATGFARVNHSIIENLPKDEYEIHHIAINYRGDPYDCDHKLYPAQLGGDLYGIGRIKSLMDVVEPDFIFVLNDPWVLPNYFNVLKEYDVPIITYFPVDAKPLRKQWCKEILEYSTPVAYTEFGKSALTDYFPSAEVEIIPHGIDSDKFFPMDRNVVRKKLEGVEEGDFVILSANRNQPRKRTDLTVEGFALFAKDKPKNVKLYLHMGLEDAGWNLVGLANRYNVDDRLLLTSLNLTPQSYVSDEHFNWIYNSADIGITNSMGEGWGLTTFEHGACKRAQIVTGFSGQGSIYPDDIVYKLPAKYKYTYPGTLTEGQVIAPEDIAEGMEFYYQNPEIREEHANKLYEFITDEKFSWKTIGQQWHELIQKVLAQEYLGRIDNG